MSRFLNMFAKQQMPWSTSLLYPRYPLKTPPIVPLWVIRLQGEVTCNPYIPAKICLPRF